MRFGFEQRWEATPDDVLAVYVDPDFWGSMEGLTSTQPPTVQSIDRSGDTAVVRLRYQLSVDLPSQAARFIDPDDVAWVEETPWALPARTATVRFLPEQAAGLLRASAAVTLVADAAEAVREVRGDLRVRIPLVGGKVEHAIVDGIGTALDEEAESVAKRLGA